MAERRGPVLIEDVDGPRVSPGDAPQVPDTMDDRPDGQAMRTMAALAARRGSALGRWFWRSAGALFVFVLSVSAWQALDALLATYPLLGWVAVVLVGTFTVLLLLICLRELAALARLARMGRLHAEAEAAIASGELSRARKVADRIAGLYAGREALRWGLARFDERRGDVFDGDALFALAEDELLAPLDAAARIEIEAAARQVATVTAVVPLAFADVAAALTSNLRMIRRIAEIYGGRAGTLGSWRLTRAVLTHLVATGAVAVGDDMIGSVAGGSVLSRVSRRFGEGVVNGALTARVGIAAMEVCRPLPFSAQPKPQVHRVIGRALSGLFSGGKGGE
ncbi:TIGR01620 family protein [Maribius pontilimi]|uniref:TIGR01620 family protein n=1 Tax=Palleronia pontilimi TaxID=1964209 RepID=A0A934MCM0_9RHOB|nr:TIGR01620 family protein [Palleronia pontilimi]MBJ3762645.1 TIGR01620 family protein [Palleronia pontilimi]